ncbi:hypothetical protein [Streptomyces sp. NPDC001422]|uniref:hypothetical protein n=1 Tax=Streptomyces sp. NPDC001422 TaxID=3364575 RepID=UPI0036B6D202
MSGFQIAWSEETPDVKHVTFSGHRTPCDRYVIEALPTYESKLEDVTCDPCGAFVVYDMRGLEQVIRTALRADRTSREWQELEIWRFAEVAARKVAGLAFNLRAEEPGENRLFSEFMARAELMTDPSHDARFIGRIAHAAIEALKPHTH